MGITGEKHYLYTEDCEGISRAFYSSEDQVILPSET